jgi:hypothetical protein
MIIRRISVRYLSDNGIEAAAIKVRKNSFADKLTHCYPRNIVVLQQLKNFEKWKDSVSYGYRWIVAEPVFSSIKRTFGEYVSARKYSNMVGNDAKSIAIQHIYFQKIASKSNATYRLMSYATLQFKTIRYIIYIIISKC